MSNYKKKKQLTIEDFDNWLNKCPVPYEKTCNGLHTTEHYSFNLIDCESEALEEEIKKMEG